MTRNLSHRAFPIKRLGHYWLLVAMLFQIGGVIAADIEMKTDRERVILDESFQLIFIAREEPDSDPDFSVLEQDFEILGQSRSSNISVVNGEFNSVVTWSLNVMAKRPGVLTIPPVPFGRDASPAGAVTVAADGRGHEGGPDTDLFMEVEVQPQQPYVQSQVIYTMRLYRRVDIARAGLSEPELPDALIEKLGDDANYTVRRNGEQFWVTERKYALFPQRSGSMTIPPLQLDAQVFVAGGADPNMGGFFGRRTTRARRIVSDAVTLEVLPVPADFTAVHWLPAEEVQLEESWTGDTGRVTVGEPVTRTLSLRVKGVTVGQLPEVGAGVVAEGLNAYPDQPSLRERKQGDGLLAFREEKIALIPSKPGRVLLPAVEVPWWNTRTGRMEVAKLPERVVEAVSGAGATVVTPAGATADDGVFASDARQPASMVSSGQQASTGFWMALSLFLGLGWGITGAAWWLQGKRAGAARRAEVQPLPGVRAALQEVKGACLAGDPARARRALLNWGGVRWPESAPGSLQALALRCGEAVQAEIALLDRALYGGKGIPWNGEALWHVLRSHRIEKSPEESRQSQPLEALHRI